MDIGALFGNRTAEKVLLYIANYGEGHMSGIAETFGISKNQVKQQLVRLENGGVFVCREMGNQRVFSFNPRFPYKKELEALLEKALSLLPSKEKEAFFLQRRRPRRTGKAL